MSHMEIENREIGVGRPTYIVAEMSGNHNRKFEKAVRIIRTAKEVGADAVKLQTYTPDTITIDCDNDYFRIKGTIWEGKNIYELYGEAYTPWEWHPRLKKIANGLGMDLFATPFDHSAVAFLESMGVPAYKVASLELVDIPLLKRIAQTGRPVILSCGMASLAEIEEAVNVFKEAGVGDIALLKCTSSYPSSPEDMNLLTIPHLSEAFGVPVGLSDHTMGIAVPTAAVALGACIIEKHLTISRNDPGPDSAFSLEPEEFKEMVDSIRAVEKALGKISYEITQEQMASRVFRKSIFAVKNICRGEAFSEENIRSIRPGFGLHPRYLYQICGKRAKMDIKRGTPLTWDCVE